MTNPSKYQEIHDNIIQTALLRSDINSYEVHHIIPASLCKHSNRYGTNENYLYDMDADCDSNLVKLTPQEHFIVHVCLHIMHPTSKEMQRACALMGGKHINDIEHMYDLANEYQNCILEYRKSQSKNTSGENNPMFGRHHSPETRAKLSDIAKNRTQSTQQKQRHSEYMLTNNPFKGKKHSEETKQKMRKPRTKGIGRNHHKWNGFYLTKVGVFDKLSDAAEYNSCSITTAYKNASNGTWILIKKEDIILIT